MLRAKNHYVPCVYQKGFGDAEGNVYVYRVLVPHPNVPEWKRLSPGGIAYHAHLYTRIVSGSESDEIEQWLDREFEVPAEEAIYRATHDLQLKPSHWTALVRFLAAQDVRTPARLLERLSDWPKIVPKLLQDVLQNTVHKLEEAKRTGQSLPTAKTPQNEYLPIRVRTRIEPGQKMGSLGVETVAGRGYWLFSIKHLLTSTIRVLLEHRWTVLQAHEDLSWFTSDDPVVRLNFRDEQHYDLKGGWRSEGTEIFLPLSPRHLLYTQVGKPLPKRRWAFSYEQTNTLRKIIAEHAHRMILSSAPDRAVSLFRPRFIDKELVRREREQWASWHADQTRAELSLLSGK